MTIEEKIDKLGELLKQIENPNISLEESVKLYELAGSLIKESMEDLKKCDGKIVEITENLKQIDFDENK